MNYTIKDLQSQNISKNLIYEALKTPLPFSRDFIKNKRVFNKNDFEIFKYYKQFWKDQTVLKFWTSDNIADIEDNKKEFSNSLQTKKTVSKNSSNQTSNDILNSLDEKIETVKKQFEEKEEKLKESIEQKNEIIKAKESQNIQLAKIKQDEKREKEEWIKKYESVQEEKGEWVNKFYNTKMYMILFWILFIITSLVLIYYIQFK